MAKTESRPSFIDAEGDRWLFFNKSVRPVMDDLATFSFFRLGLLFSLFPEFKKLDNLAKLCQKLEIVVGTTDAAAEESFVTEKGGNIEITRLEDVPEKKRASASAQACALEQAYAELYDVWYAWLKLVPPSD